jgi:hypothetical protein
VKPWAPICDLDAQTVGKHPHLQVDFLRCSQLRVLDAIRHHLAYGQAAPREQIVVDLRAQTLKGSSRRGCRAQGRLE